MTEQERLAAAAWQLDAAKDYHLSREYRMSAIRFARQRNWLQFDHAAMCAESFARRASWQAKQARAMMGVGG